MLECEYTALEMENIGLTTSTEFLWPVALVYAATSPTKTSPPPAKFGS